jgi:glycosyltransferase involved in cell wall biosynthesis
MDLLISIITVNLNNREGLRRTISSVVSQTYPHIEYLIIDGGSIDKSVELIEEHETNISHWISEPDLGIYHAMNKGIAAASGEYCLFLNSGDWLITPEVIKLVVRACVSEDILIGGCRFSQHNAIIHTFQPSEAITLASFYRQTIPHQSTFIRRSLFETYGPYREDLKLHGDYEFWIRTLIQNNCTTRPLPIVVTDYNTEGLSGLERNHQLSQQETELVLEEAVPARILADYQTWDLERTSMKAYYWAKSKPWIHRSFTAIFKLAQLFNHFRKKNYKF